MKPFGYFVVITANYSDGSTLELERHECDSLYRVIHKVAYNRSHYSTVIKEHISADDGVSIVIKVFKLNNYGIPILVSLEECDINGVWSGWSEL